MNLGREELLFQLREMDEYEFEHLVADVWEQRGWRTTVTSGSSDRGIDVIVEKSSPFSQKHLIQAKRYSADNKIGSPDIQQYSSLRRQENNVDAVVVVTTSSFSSQATQRANELNVKLVDGEHLCDMILEQDSQGFVSDYFNINTAKERKRANHTPINQEGAGRSNNESRNITSTKPTSLPDNFQKKKKTTKLGKDCPICGKTRSIWKGKTVNTDPLLICESCGTKWVDVEEKEKEGFWSYSKRTEWKALGKDTQKEASAWKEMNPSEKR